MSDSNKEIERKFLPKTLPDLSDKPKISYERHFLYNAGGIEIRIQRKNDEYEFERKVLLSPLSREQTKFPITEGEFVALKKFSVAEIIRDRYVLGEKPEVTVNIYHGRFEGLTRVEIEFESEEEANQFQPFDWLGQEITQTMLVRDSLLIQQTPQELSTLLLSLKR